MFHLQHSRETANIWSCNTIINTSPTSRILLTSNNAATVIRKEFSRHVLQCAPPLCSKARCCSKYNFDSWQWGSHLSSPLGCHIYHLLISKWEESFLSSIKTSGFELFTFLQNLSSFLQDVEERLDPTTHDSCIRPLWRPISTWPLYWATVQCESVPGPQVCLRSRYLLYDCQLFTVRQFSSRINIISHTR